jgi:NAD(P)-dependent dehydrogenase (short-subunit alcohol dehydrogenase family)
MKSIVITGSTSGIGLGLADAFLARDYSITISGHSQVNLDKAYKTLTDKYDGNRILAYFCEVSRYADVKGLWNAAQAKFGKLISG